MKQARILRRPCIPLVILLLGLGFARVARPQGAPEPRKVGDRSLPLPLDLDSCRVYVKVGSAGRFGHEHAVEGRLESGTIVVGGVGALVFDLRSFVADGPEARRRLGLPGTVSRSDQQKVTATMLGPQVLDVAHHPRATYALASVVPLDRQAPGAPGRYQLEGQFTLRGATRPLRLTALLERTEAPGVLRLRGSFAILQSEFGIEPYSALGGLLAVADRLEVRGELVLRSPSRGPGQE